MKKSYHRNEAGATKQMFHKDFLKKEPPVGDTVQTYCPIGVHQGEENFMRFSLAAHAVVAIILFVLKVYNLHTYASVVTRGKGVEPVFPSRRHRWIAGVVAAGLGLAACGEDAVITTPTDNPPTLTLSAPAGGTAVAPGASINIAWTATDDMSVAGVDLSYIADGTAATTIATGETGSSYSWTSPSATLFGVRIIAVATDDAGQTASDTTDNIFAIVASSARGYVTSTVCASCHSEKHDDLFNSGHPYKLNKVVNAMAPTYPHSEVPNPPIGFTWADISYVIGGYGWKARFMTADSGWIMTDAMDGTNVQTNLLRSASEFPDLAADLPVTWSAYHASDTERKPYTCGTCHTTGWQTFAENGGVYQDNLPGILGTWEETGITCEQCHGAGADHVAQQSASQINIDQSAELCGSCHFRDTNHNILISGGFIRHHEQYDELISADHQTRACVDCHDPHVGTRHGNAAAGGITVTCESCHATQAATNDHAVPVDCETCHMPRASKSARSVNEHQGDLRTHIFAINANPFPKDSMWTTDGDGVAISRGFVTLDFVCYQCHQDGNGVGGTKSQRTLAQLSTKAMGIHN